MQKTCFVIMPFDPRFDDIFRIIAEVVEGLHLKCVRSDQRLQAGIVLKQIIEDIQLSHVVVADLTDWNPNVLYEVGIAHQLKKSHRQVVLLSQHQYSDIPFDLKGHRHLKYQHNDAGREPLKLNLARFLNEALAERTREPWEAIHGKLDRTIRVVEDLKGIIQSGARPLIRVIAGLSSLAICDNEPGEDNEPCKPGTEEAEYQACLVQERDALRELLLAGANLQAVLHPPTQYSPDRGWRRLKGRFLRLIDLLEERSDKAAADIKIMQRCEFAITEVPHTNTYILGDVVAYEGLKRGEGRGFEMNHVWTLKEEVEDLTTAFDKLYQTACRNTLGGSTDLRKAVLNRLRKSYKDYLATCPPEAATSLD